MVVVIVYVVGVNAAGELPEGDFARVTFEVVPVSDEQSVGVVTVVGEIDMMTGPLLVRGLDEAFSSGSAGAVLIDLSEVTFFGSPGIAAVAVARDRAHAVQVQVALILEPGSATDRTLRIVGLAQLLATYPSRAAALAAFSSGATDRPGPL
jgi:anti-anti-sigma factor